MNYMAVSAKTRLKSRFGARETFRFGLTMGQKVFTQQKQA
jgi:hypothetical protein